MTDELFKTTRGNFTAFLQGKQVTVIWATWTAKTVSLTDDVLQQILTELEPEYGKVERWSELIAKLRNLGREI